jgi:hypothetical protein
VARLHRAMLAAAPDIDTAPAQRLRSAPTRQPQVKGAEPMSTVSFARPRLPEGFHRP